GRREERRREQGRREERRREEGRREERRREQRRKQRRVEEEREAESIIFGSGEWGVGSGMIFTPHSPFPTPYQRGNDHVRRQKQRLAPRRPERPRRYRRGPSGAQHKPPRARP